MSPSASSLILRLAGPLQSWGGRSRYNRRETAGEPTKSGILGLLAAAGGRRRGDPIEDLLGLQLGVRTDQAGSLLRDYHTVSDFRGVPLLSAGVTGRGKQKPTSPPKLTHVTERFYLQDAIFVAAVSGPAPLLTELATAVRNPAFPLSLGRRACVPTLPLVLTPPADTRADGDPDLWAADAAAVLHAVPWQGKGPATTTFVELPTTVDDVSGNDRCLDVPTSFRLGDRGFLDRRVTHGWARVRTAFDGQDSDEHDPFALLGW